MRPRLLPGGATGTEGSESATLSPLAFFCPFSLALILPRPQPLLALVSPGGRPPLRATSSATVFVNLLDLNDNDPTFQNLPFVAEVLEGTPAGVSIYQVSLSHLIPTSPEVGSGCPRGLAQAEHFAELGQGRSWILKDRGSGDVEGSVAGKDSEMGKGRGREARWNSGSQVQVSQGLIMEVWPRNFHFLSLQMVLEYKEEYKE